MSKQTIQIPFDDNCIRTNNGLVNLLDLTLKDSLQPVQLNDNYIVIKQITFVYTTEMCELIYEHTNM